MIVIRRMVDRRRAYTAIFLPGEPPKIFPTNDAEHARILQVYKQDRPHAGIINDFSELEFPPQPATPISTAPTAPRAAPAPWPLAQPSRRVPAKKKIPVAAPTIKRLSPTNPARPRKATAQSLWLIPAVPPG
ncbi:MAG: hypothetical protein CK548_07735 [Opitutia bacterium]|nr:hypothetical protein [Opitutaceae bacterium]PHX71034.1 MAG: hypothetical protein CK548_07735 [Opitutae bacterium]